MTRHEALAKARAVRTAKRLERERTAEQSITNVDVPRPTLRPARGTAVREQNEIERQRVRELLKPPDDFLTVDGIDVSLAVQHPRRTKEPVTVQSLIQARVDRLAQVMDSAVIGLQQEADAAQKRRDSVAFTLIMGKLLDHSSRVLTSPAAMALKPEAALVNLDQFSPETRAKLLDAFAAAEAELKAKEVEEP